MLKDTDIFCAFANFTFSAHYSPKPEVLYSGNRVS
jgi:hypothetical protein